MDILLIAPATGDWRAIARKRLFNGRTFRFSMLSLLTVAALSPKGARITIVDEQIEDVPEEDFDLVGITAMTAVAPRAYELCARFRARGIPVVMGGFHATLNTEEALFHADAVVVGPAYGAWEEVCADVRHGSLKRVYRGTAEPSVPVHLPRHLLDRKGYLTVSATFATLGCRNRCRFCSIHTFHEGRRWRRQVEAIAEEVATLPDRFFLFVDDNLTQDREYSLALCRALAPLRKRWATQVSVDAATDPALPAAMQASGCIGVFIGLETFSPAAMEEQAKGFNSALSCRDAVAAFHRHGMYVEAGMIVGFDSDGPEVFRHTLDRLEWIGIDAIQLSVLTPLPGTVLFKDMESRIVDRNWEHYDYRHVVFEPENMTREELQAGADWLIASFYSLRRIARRLVRWMTIPGGLRHFPYPLALNMAYFGRLRRFGIRGSLPGTPSAALPKYARHL